jgi:hypothetical protein
LQTGPLSDINASLASAGQDAILIGMAGVAAVLWVGSFIFLSLPQMKHRYPLRVAAGLSFLQSVFVFALASLVLPALALRVMAALWCVYYLCIIVAQRFSYNVWSGLNARGTFEFKWEPSEGQSKPEGADVAARDVMEDLMERATAWRLTLQHFLVFVVIAIWPTKYCVAVASLFLIWQGSRFVRAALLNHLTPKPAVSSKPPPRVDIEAALKGLRLGWLLRAPFVQQRIAEYKRRHPLADAEQKST